MRPADTAAGRPATGTPDHRWLTCDNAALLALGLFAVVALLTFRDYGLGWDDYTHSEYGDLLLALFGSGFSDRRALSFVNLYMYGGGYDMVAALAAKYLPFTLFETRRLIGAAVGLIGYALTWRLARRVGGPPAGLIALMLLLICPHYYGHVFMNAKDAPFAVATLAMLLACMHAIEQYPRPDRVTVVATGLGIGFAFGVRILAVVPAFCVALVVIYIFASDALRRGARRACSDFATFLITLSPALLIGYLVMGLTWPWSILQPLNPVRSIEYFSHFFEKPWKELFEGALISVPNMPAVYVPQLFLIKIPEAMLILSFTGIVYSLFIVAQPSRALRMRGQHLLILLAALVPIVTAMITRPALYNGIRHFLFVVPPLAIVGGVAAAALLEAAAQRSRWLAVGFAGLLGIGLAVPAAAIVRLHPYEYTHFNAIAGGLEGADENYMLDYWGLAFKEASDNLRAELESRGEKPVEGRPWIVAVCGPQRPAEVALGPEFQTTGDPRGADFAMMLGAFYCRDLRVPIVTEVTRDDVILARVYDLRGQTVTNLLTLPPP